MSTWDDKPNDYEHAVRLLEAKDAEIAILQDELVNGDAVLGQYVLENQKFWSALEEIVRNGDQGIHVPGPYDIAKAALTKEGK